MISFLRKSFFFSLWKSLMSKILFVFFSNHFSHFYLFYIRIKKSVKRIILETSGQTIVSNSCSLTWSLHNVSSICIQKCIFQFLESPNFDLGVINLHWVGRSNAKLKSWYGKRFLFFSLCLLLYPHGWYPFIAIDFSNAWMWTPWLWFSKNEDGVG